MNEISVLYVMRSFTLETIVQVQAVNPQPKEAKQKAGMWLTSCQSQMEPTTIPSLAWAASSERGWWWALGHLLSTQLRAPSIL